MGFIQSLLGGGSDPYHAQGPAQANINQSNAEVNQAYTQALQLSNAQGLSGVQNQQNVFGQQQNLANQLQQQSQGLGPNPAQQALANTTGQNIAQQSAMQAGQRGAGANPGLIARQAAQTGAGIQQQATGQSALMQAQQQLSAQQALMQQQYAMAGLANTQASQYQGTVGQLGQIGLGNQGQLLGAQNGAQQINAASTKAAQDRSSSLVGGLIGAAGTAFTSGLGGLGGLMGSGGAPTPVSGIGPIANGSQYASNMGDGTMSPHYQGGKIEYSEGGPVSQESADSFSKGLNNSLGYRPSQGFQDTMGRLSTSNPMPSTHQGRMVQGTENGPQSSVGKFLSGVFGNGMSQGGKVNAMLSPGEIRLSPEQSKAVARGEARASEVGSKVPGTPKVEGDSPKNDTVHAKLNQGDVIVKRSKANDDEKAQAFVKSVEMRSKKKKS